jgi:hypothetical protein
VGEDFNLDILLQTPPEFGERSISCHAMVTRVERNGDTLRVAVGIQRLSVGQMALFAGSERKVRSASARS